MLLLQQGWLLESLVRQPFLVQLFLASGILQELSRAVWESPEDTLAWYYSPAMLPFRLAFAACACV